MKRVKKDILQIKRKNKIWKVKNTESIQKYELEHRNKRWAEKAMIECRSVLMIYTPKPVVTNWAIIKKTGVTEVVDDNHI